MKFIIDLFKKATQTSPEGDSYRPDQSPDKYNDKIAQLNSLGANQYSKVNTATINKISKTSTNKSLSQGTPANTIVPGTR